MSGKSGGGAYHVAVPVTLIDGVLPSLKDTELRVLLIVLRQTAVLDRERPSAWLTHSELCRRTSRSSESVSAAIGMLVHRRLLRVTDESGKERRSAAERQAVRARLYFQATLLDGPGIVDLHAEKPKTIDISSFPYSTGKSGTEEEREPGEETRERIEAEKGRIRERLAQIR